MRYIILVGRIARNIVVVGLIGCVSIGLSLSILHFVTPFPPAASAAPSDRSAYLADPSTLLRRGYTVAWALGQDLVDGFTAPIGGRMDRSITPGPLLP